MDKIITKRFKYILIVAFVVVIGIFSTNHFLRTHDTVGIWQDVETDLKLSVFKDKTAVFDYGKHVGKVSCEWSEKYINLIVLICKPWYGEGENVMTFTTDSFQDAGYLDGHKKTTMRRKGSGNSGKKEVTQYPASLWEKSEDIVPLTDNFTPPLLEEGQSLHSAKEAIFPSELRDQMGPVGNDVLKQFALSRGQLSTSLKDRFVTKMAANDDYADTVHQKEVQDRVVNSIRRHQAQMAKEQLEYDLTNNQTR